MGLILFDIDGTLFDPEKFGKLIRAEFVKTLSITEEDLIHANADYYAGLESSADFNPRDMSNHLALRFAGDAELLNRIFWENDDIYINSVYDDVEECLKRVSQGNTLGIFSQGNLELQRRKLEATELVKYFDTSAIMIHPRKLTDPILDSLPSTAVLVDNDHATVQAIWGFLKTVWLNRKTNDVDPDVETIHSLSELTI